MVVGGWAATCCPTGRWPAACRIRQDRPMSLNPERMTIPTAWPAMLRDVRQRAGLSQAELGLRAGVAPSAISRYENGAREPGIDMFIRLVRAAGEPVDEALSELSERTPVGGESGGSALRAKVLAHLRQQGFKVSDAGILAPVATEKHRQRALHLEAVQAQRERARGALARREPRFLERLATGQDVDPARIQPRLLLITDRRSEDGLLWRWCSLHWSIPVSSGYGRRLRFLVVDEGHGGKVMGLIGLADPVFALGCRDTRIGWTREDRTERLACVMDAFVLGAVPPYTDLLGGKLAGLLTGSAEVRDAFSSKYGHRETLISQRDPDAHLALVTTSSALGRSSVYSRLYRPHDPKIVTAQNGSRAPLAFEPVGFTQGTGDFHFSGAIYEELAEFARSLGSDGGPSHRHERWTGGGFRNRREVIQRSLEGLGLDSRALRAHGVKRQVFLNPLAENSYAWLRGEDAQLRWQDHTAAQLGEWWKARWALPRSTRDARWRSFEPESWRLFTTTGGR